jgi:hypothetical protein
MKISFAAGRTDRFIEVDGSCHEREFQRLIADLISSAPPGTKFDE